MTKPEYKYMGAREGVDMGRCYRSGGVVYFVPDEKPAEPKRTPLTCQSVTSGRDDHCRAEFADGIAIEWETDNGGDVSWWRMRVGFGTSFTATYPMGRDRGTALEDVNGALLRFGYSLEAWP